VKLSAVIAKDGTIQNLEVIEGHPLLAQSALDAVRQWVYQPTLLNGQPVEVVTEIDVKLHAKSVGVQTAPYGRGSESASELRP